MGKARSEVRSISFMDLEAPRDEVLTQKDQANTCVSTAWLRLSGGKSYEVPNHDAAFVTQSKIEIGLDLNDKGIAKRSVYCAILHITQIEELQTA